MVVLKEELETAMRLLGARNIRELDIKHVSMVSTLYRVLWLIIYIP